MGDTPKRAKTGKAKKSGAAARTRLIVRRGAVQRHASLKQKTADLEVDVLWDRREADRRAAADLVDDERRKADRRKKPPFTWDVADFAVAVERDPPKDGSA
jgi:hypothetical protein